MSVPLPLDSYLRCFKNCTAGERFSVYDVIYRCPQCGGLLEVHHARRPLRASHSGQEWQQLFDARSGTHTFPYGSGVWRYQEWVMPSLLPENIVSMYEGNSNLFRADRLGELIGVPDLWIKMCGNSHTGSFKDLGMTVLISVVKQIMTQGKSGIQAVACASTGDTSAALAAYAAAADIPAIIFLPKGKISSAQLVQPVANGAHVLALATDFDGCMEIVQAITQDETIYLANSMNSLRVEGQKTVALEILQQFGWELPDWIIVPAGNLGNVSAVYKGLRLLLDLGITERIPRLVAAQAEKANPLFRSFAQDFAGLVPIEAEQTLASAIQIGNPVSYAKAVQALVESQGIVASISEDQLAHAAALGDRVGLYACPHTGVAIGALMQLAESREIGSEDRAVVVSTAHGLKFTQFKVGYHTGELEGVEARLANTPRELPPSLDNVRGTVHEILDAHAQQSR